MGSMTLFDPDAGIRMAAFEQLHALVAVHGPVLPWELIAEGFTCRGEPLLFANKTRGIFRPRQMQGAALSIKTTVPRAGRDARYDDQVASDEGYFVYRFQGSDPDDWDNRLLYGAHRDRLPLIYFYGVDPGLYRPLWPVFITGWDPANLACTVAVDEGIAIVGDDEVEIRRRYVTVEAKRRLHQDAFRAVVLRAYDTRCAICRLPRAELLEAAHILPDRDVRGRPEVPNGLALCQLHHGVYDQNLLGIRPDHVIQIAPSLLATRDGPVLEQAIKAFHGRRLEVPRRESQWPRPEYLEERFDEFRRAG